MLETSQKVRLIAQAADAAKAGDLRLLDLRGLTLIADYFVICTGRSDVQVESIAERIEAQLKQEGCSVHHREGGRGSQWVLLDFGEVVVHIFGETARAYYNLEQLWGDAPQVAVDLMSGDRGQRLPD